MNIFKHRLIDLPEGSLRISPSQLYKFYSNPSEWYRTQVLGESTFKGNTASIIGTICHYIYEEEIKGRHTTREFITEQLREKFLEDPDLALEVNVQEVQEVYPQVASAVMNEYVVKELAHDERSLEAETPLSLCIDSSFPMYLAGTCDLIQDGHIVADFKHVSKKPSEIIPLGYRLQLLAYAYMCNSEAESKAIDTIRIIYGVKPTKTIPARCIIVTEMITDEDWKLIKDTIVLVRETLKMANDMPECRYILFKDMEYKENG